MKRALALLIACGLLLGVTATSSFAADKVVIKMAGMKPDGEPETLGMRKFGEILKELSGGKYDVQVFPNSQLGKEDAYIASTRKGIIQMCATGTQTSAIQPSMAMLETPMLFDDYAHARRAMNGGKTFELITNGFTEKSGMRVLNAFPRSNRPPRSAAESTCVCACRTSPCTSTLPRNAASAASPCLSPK